MSAKFTKGPYKLARRGVSAAVRDSENRLLAECPHHQFSPADFPLGGEALANAVLFAAAPDLLTALQAIVTSAAHNQAAINAFLLLDAKKAIAKATEPT